jgi:hypothetical protein
MFVVGSELCLLRIKVSHFLRIKRFVDFRKECLLKIYKATGMVNKYFIDLRLK